MNGRRFITLAGLGVCLGACLLVTNLDGLATRIDPLNDPVVSEDSGRRDAAGAADAAHAADAPTDAGAANYIEGAVNVAQSNPIDGGFQYLVVQDFGTPSDNSQNPKISILRIYENGIELGPAHSAHVDIVNLGAGRFSHWKLDLRFSASDNSDPRSNGWVYTYRVYRP